MVKFHVAGWRGYLGSVVERRWIELGFEVDDYDYSQYFIDCHRSDLPLSDTQRSLLWSRGPSIVPSSDAIDEQGDYGESKRILERHYPGVVIRTGIVDTRKANTHDNVRVNPLTPLEWAELAWERKDQAGLHIDGREPLTRYEVGCLIAEVFGTPKPERTFAPEPLDRVQMHGRDWPPLREALIRYRDWLAATPWEHPRLGVVDAYGR